MNDQHITALATIVQDFLLFASAILIAWYLYETRKMRKAAEEQVKESQALVRAAQNQLTAIAEQTAVAQEQLEGQIRPAIVVRHHPGGVRDLQLANLGAGPALHLRLCVTDRGSGPRRDLDRLPIEISFIEEDGTEPTGMRSQGGGITALNGRSLQCEYTSLSGRKYWTIVDFDKIDNDRLIATRFYNAD